MYFRGLFDYKANHYFKFTQKNIIFTLLFKCCFLSCCLSYQQSNQAKLCKLKHLSEGKSLKFQYNNNVVHCTLQILKLILAVS